MVAGLTLAVLDVVRRSLIATMTMADGECGDMKTRLLVLAGQFDFVYSK